MDFDHNTLVAFSKSYGLFYLMGMSVVVLLYAFWPNNRDRFDAAANSIIESEDKPCQ